MTNQEIPEVAVTPEGMAPTARLWAALMDGDPAVDESINTTPSDINRQRLKGMNKW